MIPVKAVGRRGWRRRVTALAELAALAAVEMKGSAQQDKEPYPEAPLPPGGG